jgi:hypothetical protein
MFVCFAFSTRRHFATSTSTEIFAFATTAGAATALIHLVLAFFAKMLRVVIRVIYPSLTVRHFLDPYNFSAMIALSFTIGFESGWQDIASGPRIQGIF